MRPPRCLGPRSAPARARSHDPPLRYMQEVLHLARQGVHRVRQGLRPLPPRASGHAAPGSVAPATLLKPAALLHTTTSVASPLYASRSNPSHAAARTFASAGRRPLESIRGLFGTLALVSAIGRTRQGCIECGRASGPAICSSWHPAPAAVAPTWRESLVGGLRRPFGRTSCGSGLESGFWLGFGRGDAQATPLVKRTPILRAGPGAAARDLGRMVQAWHGRCSRAARTSPAARAPLRTITRRREKRVVRAVSTTCAWWSWPRSEPLARRLGHD